jgi:hypothetical protein
MTLEELTEIFKHQTTATETYTPQDTLEYFLINGYDRVAVKHPAKDIAGILPSLDGLVFDAYRDRVPVFIKPEVIIPM